MSTLKQISEVRVFSGYLRRFEHTSISLGSLVMKFAIYVPDAAKDGTKIPTLYYLSGLTCTDENFSQKATAGFHSLAKHGIALVLPDTSPRGDDVPNEHPGGEEQNKTQWDFGTGAGFYLNATKAPFDKNYRMYDYITKELPQVMAEFAWYDAANISITGHSMGGHEALTIALKNPELYQSVSAFAPIVNPNNPKCPAER